MRKGVKSYLRLTVIGGERPSGDVDRLEHIAEASTEPPTVIGGELAASASRRSRSSCFNGAADGDRRRDSGLWFEYRRIVELQRSRRR